MALNRTRVLSPAVMVLLAGVVMSMVIELGADAAPSPQPQSRAGERRGTTRAATRPATRPAGPVATRPSTAPAGVPNDPLVRLDWTYRLVLGLNLSGEQKAKVDALYARYRPAMRAAVEAGPEKVRDTAIQWTKGLILVLDESQKDAFMEKLSASGLVRPRPPHQPAGRAAEFDAWMDRLDASLPALRLSDEQQQRMGQAFKDYTAATKKVLPEADTPEQVHARLDRLKVELMDRVEAALTPEQRARLRESGRK